MSNSEATRLVCGSAAWRLLALSLTLTACDGSSSSGDSEGSTSDTTATSTTSSTGSAETGGSTAAETTAASSTSAATSEGTSTGEAGSSGSTGSSGSGSSGTTGGDQPTYPPCTFDPKPSCEAPFDLCEIYGGGSAPHHCSYNCETAKDCPVPETGDATVICGGATDDVCMLDCEDTTCPDGMTCIGTGPNQQIRRCAYNP